MVLTGYVLVTWLTWQMSGVDLSIVRLLTPSGPVAVNAYYGYRLAAWSAEPAWAALALSVSFSAVYHLMPSARRAALVMMTAAAFALQSGTLFLFVSLVVLALLAQHRAHFVSLLSVLVVAVLLVGTVRSDRVEAVIQGSDPSVLMRSASVIVAADVVSGSFPIGVGYGNFRERAVYGDDFAQFLDLSTASFYKSDIVVLNLAAELGLGGLLLIVYVFRMLGFGRLLMPTIFLVIHAVGVGTLLVPALLVLAAVRGYLDRLEPQGRVEERSSRRPAHHAGRRSLYSARVRQNKGMGARQDPRLYLATDDSGATTEARS